MMKQVIERGNQQNRHIEEEKEKEKEELVKLSKDPEIYEKLTASIAPSIWQYQ